MRTQTIAEILKECEDDKKEIIPEHECVPGKKFSGAIICTVCRKYLGNWHEGPIKIPVTFTENGTFKSIYDY